MTPKKSVEHVISFFECRGWAVTKGKNINANGPDIVAIKGNKSLSIEVKMASFRSRAWKVKRCTRKCDDLIAIVFPNSAIHFEEMSSHLQKCSKSGDRFLTLIGTVYV